MMLYIKIEVLKQPLQTAVSLSTADFDTFNVQEKMHIIVSVKDFKSVITHAETLKNYITALYSVPTRPIQLVYGSDGMQCEFTLMTTGESQGTIVPSPTKNAAVMPRTAEPTETNDTTSETMQPPSIPPSRSAARRQNQNSATSRSTTKRNESESDSLFVPLADEDREWDPQDHRENDEVLGWDASARSVCHNSTFKKFMLMRFQETLPHPTFTDSGIFADPKNNNIPDDSLAPTQRISQVMFSYEQELLGTWLTLNRFGVCLIDFAAGKYIRLFKRSIGQGLF